MRLRFSFFDADLLHVVQKLAIFAMSLAQRGIIVASDDKIVDNSVLSDEIKQFFRCGEIFFASGEPIIQNFGRNRVFERFKVNFFVARELLSLIFVNQARELENFAAVTPVIVRFFAISRRSEAWRAHQRAENVNFKRRMTFSQDFEVFNAI